MGCSQSSEIGNKNYCILKRISDDIEHKKKVNMNSKTLGNFYREICASSKSPIFKKGQNDPIELIKTCATIRDYLNKKEVMYYF